jgi:nitrogen fixation NifU-like protein
MAYSDKVIEHYENPRNVGSFEKGDDHVGTGMVGAPACGDVMKLQIRVKTLNLKLMVAAQRLLHLLW